MFLEHCERYVAERIAGMNPEKVSNKLLNTITASDITRTIEDLKEKRMLEMGEYGRKHGFA